jgi:hypothetical protein
MITEASHDGLIKHLIPKDMTTKSIQAMSFVYVKKTIEQKYE